MTALELLGYSAIAVALFVLLVVLVGSIALAARRAKLDREAHAALLAEQARYVRRRHGDH